MDFIITSVTSHGGLHHILNVACVCTHARFSADRELWEHCLSMHPACNHRRKMKQEAAGDVQLAVNDMSSRWGNNFPIHQSSSAHASLPLSGISLPALLPPLGRNYLDGRGGID